MRMRWCRLSWSALVLLALGGLFAVPPKEDTPRNAVVEGLVTYTGPVPKPVPVGEAGTDRPLVEVHARSKGLKDAVAWLEGVKAPGARTAKKKAAVVDQQNYFFIPHVLAASAEEKNNFNVITPPGGEYKHRFVAARSPVKLGCPLHAGMAAWVYVFDHPYFAVSDADGKFRLPAAPPGRYQLIVRHANGGLNRKVDVTLEAGKPLSVKVDFAATDLKP